MIWIIFLTFLLWIVYKIVYCPLVYWKNRDVAHKLPVPLLGNLKKMIFRQQSVYDHILEQYNSFPEESCIGIFQFITPILLVKNIDLVKHIVVKDFDHFTDRRATRKSDLDPILSKAVVQLKGQEWKDMRGHLRPVFTSSKMKAMFSLMSECASQLPQYFESQNKQLIEVDMDDIFARYGNDVLATCAFGIQCNSLKDRENEFFMMGKDATNFSGLRGLKLLLVKFFPSVMKILRIRFLPEYISNFFYNTIVDSIDYRLKNNIVRPDMVQLLLEARKGKLNHESYEDSNVNGCTINEESSIGKSDTNFKEITDMDITAQAFNFFFAGFDNISTTLCFIANELAIHREVQERLLKEIDEVMLENDGKPTYEAVLGMKYLDMVICETMRKWPTTPFVDRLCSKDYILRDNKKEYKIKVGEQVLIPVLGFHKDEKYFPNPEKFDPDRFSDKNKNNIIPYTYLPFGLGPRACIASRFAVLEMKIAIMHIMSKFQFTVIEKTTIPIQISKSNVNVRSTNGFWLGLEARNN